MSGNAGIYAMKKRKKPVQKPKKLHGVDGIIKSNPSKRHRDRLNGELDRLTDLLPFSEDIRTRLDKLSVLRLSVGYLRVKGFFKANMKKQSVMDSRDPSTLSEGDLLLMALNGFVIVVTAEGLVFYASPTIQDYLGFHQSDVVHQSVYELIHTDDRGLFREQLHFALNPKPYPAEQGADVTALQCNSDQVKYDPERLPPENSSFLERSFVCRFRCLLDNSSGFLALKFQGRLKYLHGQSMMSEDGSRAQSQLALFSIAVPVQTPSILEIRTKTLIFQTKHQLDFTPMGIDNRGKVVLGYSELELCMRGSGYQFIHAGDMMYCADNHIRMIKTGESGLTVFRLLSKSSGWLWVQANAKLIYKGGRPDFIIARQRALVNAEGEEHLHQRRLQLPFSFTTGEALLYEVGPTLDVSQMQSNQALTSVNSGQQEEVGGLLGCFLNQDKNAYIQDPEPQLPVDQVFMESHALVNVPSDTWQALGLRDDNDGNMMIKEEGNQAMGAMMDALDVFPDGSELVSALAGLEVDPNDLMEWENTLKKLSQGENADDVERTKAEMDNLLSNDIFAYVDSVLFKEISEANLNTGQSSCFSSVNNNQGDLVAHLSGSGAISDMMMFQSPNDVTNLHTPAKGLGPAVTQPTHNPQAGITGQGLAPQTPAMFNSSQKLSHYGPPIPEAIPRLPSAPQLPTDFFNPSVNLPGLSLPTLPLASKDRRPYEPCGQASISHYQGVAGNKLPNQTLSNQMLSNQALANQSLTNQTLSNQMLSNQALANQSLTNQTLSNQMLSNQALANQSLTNQTLSNQMLSNQALANQSLTNQAMSNHMFSNQALSNQAMSNQILSTQSLQPCPLTGMPTAPMVANGHLLHSTMQQPAIHMAPGVVASGSSTLPLNDFSLPVNPSENSTLFAGDCLVQGGAAFQVHSNHRVPPWQQNLLHQHHQSLPQASIAQSAHALPAGSHNQALESQRLPGLWAQNYNGANHSPQGGLAGPPRTVPSSCMLDKPLRGPPVTHTLGHPHHLSNGTGLVPAMPLCQRANEATAHHSPPKGYVQWGQGPGAPLVGTTAVGQENAALGLAPRQQLLPANISSSAPEEMPAMQHYLDCNKQTQMLGIPAEESDLLAIPPLVDGNIYFSDQSQLNCSSSEFGIASFT